MNIAYKKNNIHFEVSGKGKPLVLLHGFLEDHHIWDPFIRALSEIYQVIAIDLFGHGKSEKVGYVHTMEQMAEAVAVILKKLNVEQAAFVGHSMGGYVALAFAEYFPQQISQLVLLNSSPEADSPERKENRDRGKRLLKQNKSLFVNMAIKNLFPEKSSKKFKPEIKELIAKAEKLPSENTIASVEGLKQRKDRTQILKKFSGNKFIIAGKDDPVIPFKAIKEIAVQTQTSLVVFPGGHMTFLEHQRRVLDKLIELLTG